MSGMFSLGNVGNHGSAGDQIRNLGSLFGRPQDPATVDAAAAAVDAPAPPAATSPAPASGASYVDDVAEGAVRSGIDTDAIARAAQGGGVQIQPRLIMDAAAPTPNVIPVDVHMPASRPNVTVNPVVYVDAATGRPIVPLAAAQAPVEAVVADAATAPKSGLRQMNLHDVGAMFRGHRSGAGGQAVEAAVADAATAPKSGLRQMDLQDVAAFLNGRRPDAAQQAAAGASPVTAAAPSSKPSFFGQLQDSIDQLRGAAAPAQGAGDAAPVARAGAKGGAGKLTGLGAELSGLGATLRGVKVPANIVDEVAKAPAAASFADELVKRAGQAFKLGTKL